MKDITTPVAFCVICLIVGIFLRFNKGCKDEIHESPIPYYTYNGEQKDLSKSNKSKRPPSVSKSKTEESPKLTKVCKNQTAVHEAAHYVVYVVMCAEYGITAKPYSLSIIPDKTSLGRFKHGSHVEIELNIKTILAGHLADKILLNVPINEKLFTLKGYDMYNALKLCSENNIDINEKIKEVSDLIKANRDRINTVAVQLEIEKEIFFKNM